MESSMCPPGPEDGFAIATKSYTRMLSDPGVIDIFLPVASQYSTTPWAAGLKIIGWRQGVMSNAVLNSNNIQSRDREKKEQSSFFKLDVMFLPLLLDREGENVV